MFEQKENICSKNILILFYSSIIIRNVEILCSQ
nr:MAG TPA: hypothetical protein [Caudoviricetes sp.]